jgi:hypothetical protein
MFRKILVVARARATSAFRGSLDLLLIGRNGLLSQIGRSSAQNPFQGGSIRDYSANGKGLLLWTHPDSQGWRPDCSRINSPTIRVTRYRNGLQCRLPPSINFETNS